VGAAGNQRSKRRAALSAINEAMFKGDGPDIVYQDLLAQGKFNIQKCKDCGKTQFYPRVLCTHCGSTNLDWLAASGKGEVYARSVISRKPEAGGPYNVVIVTLAEGPRLMSRVDGVPNEQVKIGMKVKAKIVDEGKGPFVVFTPA